MGFKKDYLLKALDFVDEALLKAHDTVAVVGEVMEEAVKIAEDNLFEASVKVSEYRSTLDTTESDNKTSPFDEGDSVEETVKPVDFRFGHPEEWTLDEKITYLIEEYGQDDSDANRDGWKASGEYTINTVVEFLWRRGL